MKEIKIKKYITIVDDDVYEKIKDARFNIRTHKQKGNNLIYISILVDNDNKIKKYTKQNLKCLDCGINKEDIKYGHFVRGLCGKCYFKHQRKNIYNSKFDRVTVKGGKTKDYILTRYIYSIIDNKKLKRKDNIDHINHNTLDNRRSNLRKLTTTENLLNSVNKEWRTNGINLPVGVYTADSCTKNPYIVKVGIQRKIYYLGCFPTIEKAVKARKKFIVKKFPRLK